VANGESDRRSFPRVRKAVPVRFKFLSSSVKDPEIEAVYEGSTQDLSLGGLLLLGPVPRMEWLKDLLLGHIQIGINLALPTSFTTVKALTRLSWIEARDPDALTFRMGLRVVDIPSDSRSALSDFLSKETRIP